MTPTELHTLILRNKAALAKMEKHKLRNLQAVINGLIEGTIQPTK